MPAVKRLLTCLLVLVLAAPPAAADDAFAVLSLWYPVSTNRNPDVDTHFRLSLIHSRVGSLSGLDVNLIASQTSGNLAGLQFNGPYSGVYGSMRGVQFTAGVNYVREHVRGVQFALVSNYVEEYTKGLQFAGLLNYSQTSFWGVQFTSGMNLTEGASSGVQFAAMANVTEGPVRGLQLASFVNAARDLRGMQFGMGNLAQEVRGAQFGILNIAEANYGLQVAPINYAKEQHGVPVALVNYGNGVDFDLVVFGSNLMAANVGLRTTVNRFYSVIAVGRWDVFEEDQSEASSASWNFGYKAPIARQFELGGDLGFVHIDPDNVESPEKNGENHYAVQARATGEWRVSRKVSVFAAVGGSAIVSDYAKSATTDIQPHFAAGLALF